MSGKQEGGLTLGVKLSYALPRLACSLFSQHIGGKARKYYTDGEPDISPATLAMLVAVLKCFDLFIGMMIGYYSDNCRSKYGRRKPFIAGGAPLWCTAVFMLCLAPSGLSAQAYVWYFGLFYFLYYSVGWSMTVITYDALAMELTTDYDERSSLFGYKGMSQMIGYILYFAAAGVFAGTYPNDVHKQVFIPGILFCVAVLLAFGQMLLIVDEPPQSEAQIKAAEEDDDGVVPMVRRMLRNPVYRSYLWFKAPGSMAFEIPGSILAYYIQYAIFDTNPNLSQTLAGAMTVGGSILAIPVVVKLCKTFDKHMVLFGFLLVYGSVLTLAAFIPPSIGMVYILGSMIGIGMGAWFVVPDALLGDCIDYDELHTGIRSESGYTVIETNLQQFMEVPAYAIPFTTVGLLGYLSNGGCGCGCGYGREGCVYAPLTLTHNVTVDASSTFTESVTVEETVWQSALVIAEGDEGYEDAISCGGPDIYTRLNLNDLDKCKPYDALDQNGKSLVSFEQTCNAVFADGPCSMDGLVFSGDDSTFGEDICVYTDGEIGGPEAYCTYQPPAVRIGFIVFQCLLPGICGLLAAWGTFRFPLLRASHAEVVAGIAAHNEGDDDVQDPLTKISVPVPNLDPAWKAAQAAYDHYSDSELQAAAAAPDKAGALALLKGKVTKSIGLEVAVLILMLVLVLVAAIQDTTEELLWLSVAVSFASLVSALVVFVMAFDVIRWQHLRNVMSDAAYLEPEQLTAQIVVIQTRTMRALSAEAASGADDTQLQTELNPAPIANDDAMD